jgi:nucleoside-diphosphate-sugar epimerase
MDVQLVIGAGAIGAATAQMLADRGERVRLVTRSGGGPEHPAVERVAADASDADALSRLAASAAVIYSCAGPAYHRWATDWPPLADALLRAAETSGALLVTTGNLYGYGAVDGPIAEGLPLRPNTEKGKVRVRIWNEALEAHRAGRIRTAEVRSSDYLGAGAVTPMTLTVLPKVLAGKRASAPADLDAPHSWTYTGDVARTLLAVAADARSWGRAWHVPTGPPESFREVATRVAELAHVPAPRLSVMPYPVLWLAGLFNPLARASRETQYQIRKPFVLDSTAATEAFGISPAPLDDALRETIADLRSRSSRGVRRAGSGGTRTQGQRDQAVFTPSPPATSQEGPPALPDR